MIKINFRKKIHTVEGLLDLNISTYVPKASFISIYGESGSGKTTILRILAGLQVPDDGTITVDKVSWYHSQDRIFLSPQKRNIGYVSQKYLLFPSMTVRQNLEYAKQHTNSNTDIYTLLKVIDLEKLQDKKATQLSGGQQQRVAFARALVQKPKILLLDEPFSALDIGIRNKMHVFLKTFQKENNTTILMASHDREEVCKMSDQIWLLQKGRIIKEAPPLELLTNMVAGQTHILKGTVLKIIDQTTIIIQIGENSISYQTKSADRTKYQIGDMIFWNTLKNQIETSQE
ncbi:ABC transporter ATP-binding protein [Aquimarina sp. ERC-38]|uniref:ABC transporter ATP-binding protein n=1 Tax=Aquimarina sp. ERC-38 TaxID=2949996 RepID=UPI0022477817|nr:ABC transporter ATP-binding protein [Aquimarina sp. ERC-38]UZO81147.1 ABC transporter ATP-binding protein [Aquimarina sp. ERC-38]